MKKAAGAKTKYRETRPNLKEYKPRRVRVGLIFYMAAVSSVFLVAAFVVLAVTSVLTIRSASYSATVNMSEARLWVYIAYLSDKIAQEYGELSLKDGGLVGSVGGPIKYNHRLVDEVASKLNVHATIFVREGADYRRISTSIVDIYGKRVVDTYLGTGSAAYDRVSLGAEYIGPADILGEEYLGVYKPVFAPGRKGEVIGVLFVGLEMSEINEYIKSVSGERVKTVVILAVVSLLFALLLTYAFYRLMVHRPASDILGGLKALWHWNLTQDVPLSSYDEMGDIERYINVTMENIKAQSDQLKEALGRAGGDPDSVRGGFFSSASHKIRTLLSAVIGMAAIGKGTDNVGRKNYAFDKIEDASAHLLGVINDTMAMGAGKEADPAQQPGQAVKKAVGSVIPAFPGRSVLLAEDVEINREIVLTMLEPTKAEIDCAANGAAALRMFARSPEKYGMIFMDVQMPEMDGCEATRRIRELSVPQAKTVPIVAMTANVFKEDIDKCLAAGMNSHLGKPLDFDEVFSKMREYLG